MDRFFLMFTIIQSVNSNCYPQIESVDHFKILRENTVETKRGCEVLCDKLTECTGFSFRDEGLQSPCSLLGAANQSEICSLPMMIYSKQTTECPVRSNLTAELGVVPCVDEIFPNIIYLQMVNENNRPICPYDKTNVYVIRMVLDDGSRITLDNGRKNSLFFDPVKGMRRFFYNYQNANYERYGVAAVCATAGGIKCPCGGLPISTYNGCNTTYPVITEKKNPCGNKTAYGLPTKLPLSPASGKVYQYQSKESTILCQAGLWMWWLPTITNQMEIMSACCFN